MDFKVINLKQYSPTVEQALAMLMIELEVIKKEGVKLLKVIHGYGSSGTGGAICVAVRNLCRNLKKQKQIKDYFTGGDFTISNATCFAALVKVKDFVDSDHDLNSANPGITFIEL